MKNTQNNELTTYWLLILSLWYHEKKLFVNLGLYRYRSKTSFRQWIYIKFFWSIDQNWNILMVIKVQIETTAPLICTQSIFQKMDSFATLKKIRIEFSLHFFRVATWEKAGFHKVNKKKKMCACPEKNLGGCQKQQSKIMFSKVNTLLYIFSCTYFFFSSEWCTDHLS